MDVDYDSEPALKVRTWRKRMWRSKSCLRGRRRISRSGIGRSSARRDKAGPAHPSEPVIDDTLPASLQRGVRLSPVRRCLEHTLGELRQ